MHNYYTFICTLKEGEYQDYVLNKMSSEREPLYNDDDWNLTHGVWKDEESAKMAYKRHYWRAAEDSLRYAAVAQARADG